jgi:hypothetical protein
MHLSTTLILAALVAFVAGAPLVDPVTKRTNVYPNIEFDGDPDTAMQKRSADPANIPDPDKSEYYYGTSQLV